MLHTTTTAAERRARFRAGLASGTLQRLPGAPNPLAARMIADAGFEGVYLSGAVVAADLALPDVGLTTLTEVAGRAGQVARVTDLPLLVDADTGFGEPLSVARTVQVLEDVGAAGCHLEDQENPKRCGHLAGKHVRPVEAMERTIAAAVRARRDPGFVLCARTDAAAVEGPDAAIERARRYVDAGADMIFAEAMADAAAFARVRAAIDVPLLANMTEFGRSELLTAAQLTDLGIDAVIYPVTLLRLAMGAVADGLAALAADGTQAALVGRMQTRDELYRFLDYDAYATFDDSVAGFRPE
ncbi:methylisocitrate lyase [Actinomycetospora sp. CA-084318]|uniref:methylisocitrate lyase n=1 Tax=Actinomycetospora sp. CA-084318 TaxID=3239892 RepID=UPI003D97DB2E